MPVINLDYTPQKWDFLTLTARYRHRIMQTYVLHIPKHTLTPVVNSLSGYSSHFRSPSSIRAILMGFYSLASRLHMWMVFSVRISTHYSAQINYMLAGWYIALRII